MLSKFTPAKCCCGQVQKNPCPCLDGTLIGAKGMTVTGVTMSDPGYPTMNRTFSTFTAFSGSCRFIESHDLQLPPVGDIVRVSTSGIIFTRQKQMEFGSAFSPSFDTLSVSFAAGVKAVVALNLIQTRSVLGPHLETVAIFDKVLADSDGFVDCEADILSGFVFNDQKDFDEPTFDASSGSVTYA